ncbi:hypothetical protein MHK_005917 [Candidatus Magnetomorum sp. HK-1]|nr:hypothetical protein MHK_005917 [Candidatus Magnetomorum sp. HK-1]
MSIITSYCSIDQDDDSKSNPIMAEIVATRSKRQNKEVKKGENK